MDNRTITNTSQIRIRRCSSCGAILQDTDSRSAGYISPQRLRNGLEAGFCDRCYSLRHYNSAGDPEFGADYIRILAKATASKALVVYVLDLFMLESSLIGDIGPYLGDNVLVILNKRDVLPKSSDDGRLISFVRRRLLLDAIEPKDILAVSSAKNLNLDALFEAMNRLRAGRDVYFVGASAVGKSSIVNAILRSYRNETARVISTNHVEGTRLDVMEIPLDDVSSMYDTPGIFNPRSAISQLERSALKYIIPKEEIVPRRFIAGDGQCFILGSIAVFEFIEGPKTQLTFMFSNEIAITRAKAAVLSKTFRDLAVTGQARPCSPSILSLDDLTAHEIVMPASGKLSIRLFGLGLISMEGLNQHLRIYLPAKVGVKLLADS